MIPAYNIHISPLKALLYRRDPFCDPARSAAILCSSDFSPLSRRNPFVHYIRLEFQDTPDARNPYSFRPEQAETVARFIDGLPAGITDLFIACDAGSSRSPAIAAALLRASGRSDKEIWQDPKCTPNPLVYRLACRAFYLYTPKLLVFHKARSNRRAYRMAQRGRA